MNPMREPTGWVPRGGGVVTLRDAHRGEQDRELRRKRPRFNHALEKLGITLHEQEAGATGRATSV